MFGESIGRVKMRRQVALFGVAILAGTVVAASPAHAADTNRPVIKSAVMGDTNGNDHSDRITLTYSEPIKHLDDKGDGYTVADRDCMPTNASIHPKAVDVPDLHFVDSNCDGIDGDGLAAVFVSPAGS